MNGEAASPEGALAIICGRGTLPFAVADAAIARGRKVVMFGLRGMADPARLAGYHSHHAYMGQFGRFCRIASAEGCRDVVFIGGVSRPTLRQLRPDWKTLSLLPRIYRLYRGGDDYLLSGIGKIFEDEGFRWIGPQDVAPEILMPKGSLGSKQPDARDLADIVHGLTALDAMAPHDIGQAVVIAEKYVLAVEAAEGTDRMLMRIAELRRDGGVRTARGVGVLVKAPKRQQDRRIDLPSIGPRTIELAAEAGLAGVAIVAGASIVAEAKALVEMADREGLFVVGIDGKP